MQMSWGSKKYIESLHRTYGVPLPGRDDESFARALDFRMREKAYYRNIGDENEFLREQLKDKAAQIEQMRAASMRLADYYKETSSKQNVKDVQEAGSSGVDVPSDVRVHEPIQGRVKQHREPDERGDDGVSGKVLPTELPDPGGPVGQHAGDGPEPGGGGADGAEGA